MIQRYLSAIVALARREPIRAFSILRTTGSAVLAFYPGLMSPAQQAAVLAVAVAWLGIDEFVRQQTTSLAKPTLPQGTRVTITTPAGEPDRTTIVR